MGIYMVEHIRTEPLISHLHATTLCKQNGQVYTKLTNMANLIRLQLDLIHVSFEQVLPNSNMKSITWRKAEILLTFIPSHRENSPQWSQSSEGPQRPERLRCFQTRPLPRIDLLWISAKKESGFVNSVD